MRLNVQVRRVCRFGTLLSGLLALACSKGSEGNAPKLTPPAAEDTPETITIPAADVIAGVAKGKLRQGVSVPAFRISKHPTTVKQYRACVAKGACSPPASRAPACVEAIGRDPLEGPTFEQGNDALPITCVMATQAQAFCDWVSGSLPTASAWLLAARGTNVVRHAWGDTARACDVHPGVAEDANGTRCENPTYVVGSHKAGASPTGAEDVLLGHGEIIAAETNAPFNACTLPHAACVAYGESPGAIDAFEPIVMNANNQEVSTKAATFRCAFEGSM